MEIFEQSPYSKGENSASAAGLFMQALQDRAKQLPNLVQPFFGEHVADVGRVVGNHPILRTVPVIDAKLAGQIAALQLGSKLVMNPLNGRVELLRSEPLQVPALRERAELAVTPFNPFLDYVAEKSNATKPSNGTKQQRARRDGAAASRSLPVAKKRAPHEEPLSNP